MNFRESLILAITEAVTKAIDSVFLGTSTPNPLADVPAPVLGKTRARKASRTSASGNIDKWEPNESARRVPKAILSAIGITIEKGSKEKIANRFPGGVWSVKDGAVSLNGRPYVRESSTAAAPAKALPAKAKGPLARKIKAKG